MFEGPAPAAAPSQALGAQIAWEGPRHVGRGALSDLPMGPEGPMVMGTGPTPEVQVGPLPTQAYAAPDQPVMAQPLPDPMMAQAPAQGAPAMPPQMMQGQPAMAGQLSPELIGGPAALPPELQQMVMRVDELGLPPEISNQVKAMLMQGDVDGAMALLQNLSPQPAPQPAPMSMSPLARL